VVGDERQPFDKLHVPESSKNDGERREFTPAEVVQLHAAALALGHQQLADLIQLAAYSGMRREEICGLHVANVHADHFEVIAKTAKTKASRRQVPIHSRLRSTVRRLVKASRDGYLLSGLGANRYGARGGALGHRFSRLRRAQGFGAAYVFHSIRHTVATQLEEVGVRLNVIDDILGWKKPGMLGRYSGGNSLAVKRKAIQKLKYPS
jgi:integrase